MRPERTTNPHWTAYRERYQHDLAFREQEKERVKQYYTPKERHDEYEIDGIIYITSKLFCAITGLTRAVMQRLLKDGIIRAPRRLGDSNRLLFYRGDAYLFRDILPKFIKYPHLSGFNSVDQVELKKFMNKNTGKYDHENKVIN